MANYTFNLYLLLPVLAGVGLALAVLLYTRARGLAAFRRSWGIFLVIAAVIYIGFALAWGSGQSVGIELVGVVIFTVVAGVGVRWWPLALPIGWTLHVIWDLLLHPVQSDALAYAPWWYPALCVGFDLFAAGFLTVVFLPGEKRSGTKELGRRVKSGEEGNGEQETGNSA